MGIDIIIADQVATQYAMSATWTRQLNGRGTAQIELGDPDGNYDPAIGQLVGIWDTTTGQPVFGGSINSEIKRAGGDGEGHFISCEVVSHEQRLDKRLVRTRTYKNTTVEAVVYDLINDFANGENIYTTSPSVIDADIPVDKIVYDTDKTVAQALNELAILANCVWWVDPGRFFYFVPRSFAVFSTTIDDSVVLDTESGQKVTITRSRNDLFNREFIRFNFAALSPEIETFEGDGAARTWALAKDINRIESITVDGKEASYGVDGVDAEKQFYFTPAEKTIRQDDSQPILTSANSLVVTYRAMGADIIMTDDPAAIAARAAAEGGTGLYEHYTDDNTNTDVNAALAKAQAFVNEYKGLALSVEFETDLKGLEPGQLVNCNITYPHVSGQWLVESVAGFTVAGLEDFRYRVRLIDGRRIGGWLQFWEKLAGRLTTGNGVALTGSTYEPPQIPGEVIVEDQPTLADLSIALGPFAYSIVGQPVASWEITCTARPANCRYFTAWTYEGATPPSDPTQWKQGVNKYISESGATVISDWAEQRREPYTIQATLTASHNRMQFPGEDGEPIPVLSLVIPAVAPPPHVTGFAVQSVQIDKGGVPCGYYAWQFEAPTDPQWRFASLERIWCTQGKCNVSGATVTRIKPDESNPFIPALAGQTFYVDNVPFAVLSVVNSNTLTLSASAGTLSDVKYGSFVPAQGAEWEGIGQPETSGRQWTEWPSPSNPEYWLFRAVSVAWSTVRNETGAPTVQVITPSSGGVGTVAPAPNVLGLSLGYRYPEQNSANPDIIVTITPPSPIGTFEGIVIADESEDQSNLPAAFANGLAVADGSFNVGGEWKPQRRVKLAYTGDPIVYPLGRAVTEELKIRVYAASYNAAGMENPFVRAYEPGATPNATLTIQPPGTYVSGQEYGPNPVNCSATVEQVQEGGIWITRVIPHFSSARTATPSQRGAQRRRGSGAYVEVHYRDKAGKELVAVGVAKYGVNPDGTHGVGGTVTFPTPHVQKAKVRFRGFTEPSDTATTSDDSVNNYAPGITPEITIDIGKEGGTVDLGQSIEDSVADYMEIVNGVLGIVEQGISRELIALFAVSQNRLENAQIIDAARLVDAAVLEAKIALNAVTGNRIADLSVGTAKMQALSVTTSILDNLAATNGKIANLAVSGVKIQDAEVGTLKLANGAATTLKIATAAITNALLGNLAVGTANIQDLAVTMAKLNNIVGKTLTLNTNGIVTTVDNAFEGTMYAGLRIRTEDSSFDTLVGAGRMIHRRNGLTFAQIFADSDRGRILLGTAANSSVISIDSDPFFTGISILGDRVLRSRYPTRPSTTAEVIDVLVHHGLCA